MLHGPGLRGVPEAEELVLCPACLDWDGGPFDCSQSSSRFSVMCKAAYGHGFPVEVTAQQLGFSRGAVFQFVIDIEVYGQDTAVLVTAPDAGNYAEDPKQDDSQHAVHKRARESIAVVTKTCSSYQSTSVCEDVSGFPDEVTFSVGFRSELDFYPQKHYQNTSHKIHNFAAEGRALEEPGAPGDLGRNADRGDHVNGAVEGCLGRPFDVPLLFQAIGSEGELDEDSHAGVEEFLEVILLIEQGTLAIVSIFNRALVR